jgi:5'-3' exonuclease
MKLGKHTLIIDGNYFVHSRLFVLPRVKGKQLLGDIEGQEQLMRKLCIDLASEVRKMTPFVDQVVVAVDSKSWRKDLFPAAAYKGTRVLDDSVNWSNVFDVYEQWQGILATKGVIVHKVPGAEADDILFGWANALNNEGKNCIVWTGDRDLIQLVNYNKATDAYTLWYYNSQRKLLAFEGFESLLESNAATDLSNDDMLFNMSSAAVMNNSIKEEFQKWIVKNTVQIQEINCDAFIFSKILQGDKSDNIKSVVTWTKQTKEGSIRNYSITEKHATKILSKYREVEGDFLIDHFFSANQVNVMINLILEVVERSNINEIKVNFNQNLDLMLLHYNTIPMGIQKAMYIEIDKDFNVETQMIELTQMEKILDGTTWNSKKSVGNGAPKSFDPFAKLNIQENINKSEQNNKINTLF